MGIHTGDSITVAPAQTLTDKEYQIMRDASLAVLREIGVETGGSNVQFAHQPGHRADGRDRDEPARVALVGAGLQGHRLPDRQDRRQAGRRLHAGRAARTTSPAARPRPRSSRRIDYVVTKIPRFTFEKFPQANDRLTTQMKSVGEVMAIGRTFQESLQKALRGLEIGNDGLDPKFPDCKPGEFSEANLALIKGELQAAGAERICFIADAMRAGMSVDEIFALTNIDRWFLVQLEDLVRTEQSLGQRSLGELDAGALFRLKRKGFSDARLSKLLGVSEKEFRKTRQKAGIRPVYKRVDTCAAEFASHTAYMYSTYEEECEAAAQRSPEDHGAGRRAQPHRPGHRVRLLLRARGAGDARGWLRDDHGQLQSGNRLHRL